MADKPTREELEQRIKELEKEAEEGKRGEDELRRSKGEWEDTFDAMSDWVSVTDLEARIVQSNQAGEEFTGVPLAEIVGQTCCKLVHGTDAPIPGCPLQKMLRTHHRESAELQVPVGDSWLLVTVDPVKDMDGNLVGAVHIARDITERKRVDEALERSRKTLLEEHKQRKLLSKQLITLLEADRRKVAIELHDQIGQTLTALKMDLEMVSSKLKATDPDVKDILQSAEDQAIQAMGDLRQVAHGLRPSALDDLGLSSALHVLFDDIKQHMDMEINFFRRNIPKRIEPEKEEAIYRIIQEALINVVKHAKAKKVFVNLIREEESITLGVEDDGVGFDVSEVMKVSRGGGPLGLLIMQERAVQADGEFSVESRIGSGTHLLARIPV